MCGIAGFFDVPEASASAPRLLRRMLSAIHHRGPDEQGLYFDRRAGLATARLSIIDLSTGQQPMTTDDGRYCLAFNGEIFNYIELRKELETLGRTFRTSSDTEVLLHALATWGEDALPRLNGQFAFLFYDRRAGRLLMARDRFGERPLFYSRHADGIAAASEIKALFALPFIRRAIAPAALARLFTLWTTLPEETVFEGVAQLPPGTCAVFANGQLDVRPYYRLPLGTARPMSLDDAVGLVRERLQQSVRLRLRSDVEVGTYSSGGLDSTITTYLAQQENAKPVRTFAIGFEDADFDETRYQDEVAKRFGTQHLSLRIKKRDIAACFPDVVWHAETAQFRTAPAPMFLLAREVKRSGIKVVLTGEGADEAFLGYDLFKEALFRADFDGLGADARVARVRGMYPYLSHFKEENAVALIRSFSQHVKERTPGLFSHEMRFANAQFATRLLSPSGSGSAGPVAERALADAVAALDARVLDRTPTERAQLLEYETLLHGYLLSSQGDRMSSAHGVEARCPFLDPNVVDAAFAIPEALRLAGSDEKHVLKAAYKDALPDSVITRPKQPYRAPDAHAFTSAFNEKAGVDWVDDLLAPGSTSMRSALFESELTRQFVDRMRGLPAERIGPREDHAFVLLMSTLLLERQFVTHLDESRFVASLNLVREIDATGSS